jgi:hypothetical protein
MSEDPKARVQQLRDAELALEDQLAEARTALAAAREREADAALSAALDGGSGKPKGEGAAAIAERIGASTAAIAAARTRRVEAINAAWQAEAAALREQAAETRAESDAHAAKTAELLAALEAHEQAPFCAEVRLLDARIAGGLVVGGTMSVAIPKSEWMHSQAAALEQQAASVENRQMRVNGSIGGASRDEILAQVRAWDPMALAPALHAVVAWCEEQEAALRARIGRTSPDFLRIEDRERIELAYALTWRDGELVETESAIRAFRRQTVGSALSRQAFEETVAVA